MTQTTQQIIIPENLVFPEKDRGVELDCSHLATDGVVFIGADGQSMWIEKEPFTGRITDYDFTAAIVLWDQAASILADQDTQPQEPYYPQFTALEMLDLFTEAEQLAVVQATMSSPAVKLWYDRLIAATFVTYEDPRTDGGLQALVTAGLITAERKAEIVAAMQPIAL